MEDPEHPLISEGARPLFGRFKVWRKGVLFLFEAPNRGDTFDQDKGYITYDDDNDPTATFTRQLMHDELGLAPALFQVTNSVLCLPAEANGRFPVRAAQKRLCARLIREQILALDPAVVVPVGGAALDAARLLDRHPYRRMCDAAAKQVRWFDRWLFPLFHTSRLARNKRTGRSEEEQRQDWRRLRAFLREQGVEIPVICDASRHGEGDCIGLHR